MSNEADQEKLLARWLSGTLSEDEKQLLNKEGGLDDLRFALDDLEGWKVPELDRTAGLKDLKSRIKEQSAPKQSKQIFFQPWLRVAASIVLLAAAYFVINSLLQSGPTIIRTDFGETLSHTLPDGSVVNLDAHSSISYSKKDWDSNRQLDLEGRALFSVQKGETFRVDTEEGSVTVLGTVFDVTQRVDGQLAVNCYEGRVRVDIGNQEELLRAGQGLVSIDQKIDRVIVNGDKPAWVDQKSNYNQTTLSDVVQDLEDFYGIEITLSEDLANTKFTGELNYRNLEDALTLLSTVFEVSYTQEGTKIVFE